MAKNDTSKGGKGAKGAAAGKGGKGGAPAKGGKGGAPQGKGGAQAKGGKGASAAAARQAAAQREHTGAGLPVAAPRLKQYYEQTVRGRLAQQFALGNPHQVPTLEKIVVNCGVGEAIKQPRVLDTVVEELAIITGQRPVRR